MRVYKSSSELIGNTPLLELVNIEEKFNLKAKLYAKIEALNPGGSIKDRVAREMLDTFEKEGKLNKDTVIIEPTSGNTGIGLASLCASRGYKLVIVMPDTMSIERRKTMLAYGAKLVLTPGKDGMSGAIKKAEELAKENENSIIAGQFVNPANPLAHYKTTGPEIYNDLDGMVDVVVAGIGTGGTISGIGKYLKEKKSDVKIIGLEPETSPVITAGHGGPHKIQGIGAGFIPDTLNLDVVDEVRTIKNEDAFEYGRIFARSEGILVGISSGCALKGAIDEALKEENRGKNIVAILPDTGDRYLSTALFDGE